LEPKRDALFADWKGKHIALQLEWETMQSALNEEWKLKYGELKTISEKAAAALQAE